MTFSRRAMRLTGLAGIAAAACYLVGDVLLLGRKPDPERHSLLRRPDIDPKLGSMFADSAAPLRAGALVGVLATPLRLVWVWHLRQGLGPAGRSATTVLALAQTLPSFVHGMFYPWGESYRLAQQFADADQPEAAAQLIAQGRDFEKAIKAAYLVYGAAVLGASVRVGQQIARGTTGYPRWSAPIIAPIGPMVAATALLQSPVIPDRVRYRLLGASFSIGDLIAAVASTLLRWRR